MTREGTSVLQDQIWLLERRSRSVQDFRKDIQSIWNDEAAREINNQYLAPHESDDKNMLKAFKEHQRLSDRVKQKCASSREYFLKINESANQLPKRFELIRENIQSAHCHNDEYLSYREEARAQFREIRSLIKQANQACD